MLFQKHTLAFASKIDCRLISDLLALPMLYRLT
jgi:hypothetical protein